MREPFSQDAEQGLLGAMLIKPELIDLLSAELTVDDFFYADNRDVFKAIMALRDRDASVDFITVAEEIGMLSNGDYALGYTGQLHRYTVSVANAKEYARIVLERSVDRALYSASTAIYDIAAGEGTAVEKIARAQGEVGSINMASTNSDILSASDAVNQHVAELERREALGGAIDGLTTGIDSLDAKIQGLKPEQVIVIAGRPKMGKTTFAMNIADHVAVSLGKQVLVFSLEMSTRQLMDKSLSSIGGIPLDALKHGRALKTHPAELNTAATKIAGSGMQLYARKSATVNQIRSVARRHKLRHGLDLVVVDHIGLVDVDDHRAGPVQRVSEVTRTLKLMAKELGCPVIALSQLNRELEKRPNKRPIPSDLRDSGSIEQDADMIWFVYRDEVYDAHTSDKGIAEIIVGIARDLEPCTVKVQYQGKYSRFCQLAADYVEGYTETKKPAKVGMDF